MVNNGRIRRSSILCFGALGVFALLSRLLLSLYLEVPIGGDANHYLEMANGIRANHQFALNGAITAHRPPLYPLFLAAVQSFSLNPAWPKFLQGLMSFGSIVLVSGMLLDARFGRCAALGAFVFGTLSPAWIYYPSTLFSETLFGFLLVLSLLLLWRAMRVSTNGKASIVLSILSGIALGLATLTRSVLLLLPFFLIAAACLHKSRRHILKPILIITLAWTCTLLPWTIRNYLCFDAFIPVNTMGGIVLYQGAHPHPEGFGFTPWEEIDAAAGTHDEVERNRVLTREAIHTYVNDPLRTIRLAALKFLWFWNPWDGDSFSLGSSFNPHTFLLIVFAGAYAFFAIGSQKTEAESGNGLIPWLFSIVLLYFVLMALLFYGSPRFRMPVEPLLWCFAGLGFCRVMNGSERKREILVVCILGSSLFLYLAGDLVKEGLRTAVDMILGYREFWGKGSP
ncbi:MAG: phospholipid carrier-dependent glycosyltransferase [Candidatus Omnitrophica bacterium]|nr:phospholipid carrier-dependent glycosyltransferase [Candidatus Omnitrophota bacterium]